MDFIQKPNQHQETTQSIFIFAKIGQTTSQPIAKVDFSPISSSVHKQSFSSQQQYLFKKMYPVFNRDANYYTPSFIIQNNYRRSQQENNEHLLNLHRNKVQALQQKDQIYLPKPDKRNSVCSICKVAIDDYLQHVALPQHTQLLQKCQFYKDILHLCDDFVHKKKKISKLKHKKGDLKRFNVMKQNINNSNLTSDGDGQLDYVQFALHGIED